MYKVFFESAHKEEGCVAVLVVVVVRWRKKRGCLMKRPTFTKDPGAT